MKWLDYTLGITKEVPMAGSPQKTRAQLHGEIEPPPATPYLHSATK
ncbi:hypothetical protein [Aeromonas veronii]|nr:hypothetical protein [Aeromonas veronii]